MPPFSRWTALAATAALFLSPTRAAYTLQDDYNGSNFFNMFSFFTDADPTHGYVDYISQSSAQSAGLINTNNNQIYMGVDTKNTASGRGRQSVRLTSKATYNHALIILDLAHMPIGCGTWPAFWTVGPNWPHSGEIDIIEGVNMQSHNAMTLHTSPGCSIGATSPSNNGNGASNSAQTFSGTIATSNCDVNAAGQSLNAGCSISNPSQTSYGTGFNSATGGIYATEWTPNYIRIWNFPRSALPSDITSSTPDPSTWGTPQALFPSTACSIPDFFKNQQIVFDTTFCGDWAGAVWASDPICSAKAPTCQEYVQNNPAAFADAYWAINSLKVFSSDGNSGTASIDSMLSRSDAIESSVAAPTASGIAPTGTEGKGTTTAPPPTPPQQSQTKSGNDWSAGGHWTSGAWSWGGSGRGAARARDIRDDVRGTSSSDGFLPKETGLSVSVNVNANVSGLEPERADSASEREIVELRSLIRPVVRRDLVVGRTSDGTTTSSHNDGMVVADDDEVAVVKRRLAEHRARRSRRHGSGW